MSTEVFRFVSIRPPQASDKRAGEALRFTIEIGDSSFLKSVREARTAADRVKLVALAERFTGSPEFVGVEPNVDPRILELGRALASASAGDARQQFQRIFSQEPGAFVASESYATLRRRLGESIVAAAIDASEPPQSRALLASLAATVAAIDALASGRDVGKTDLDSAVIVLPAAIFPLPRKDESLDAQRAARREQQKRDREKARAALLALSHDLTAQREAIDELINTLGSRASDQPGPIRRRERSQPAASTGFSITAEEHARLSERTRTVLKTLGVAGAFDPGRTIERLEARLAETAAKQARPSGSRRLVRVGSNIIPGDLLVDVEPATTAEPSDRHPGPCPPQAMSDSGDDQPVTVPTGHGEARILGMADLMLVEQQLARYELGEIAHIENVLKHERRERRFTTSTETEQSTTTETEQTEDKEQDLSSSDRFELQTETQNVINDTASKQAGLTIHASYGPSVDATATLNYTTNTARQHSDRAASSFARETTSRAVSRMQKRTLERRFTRTVQKVSERNLHSFDNSQGNEHITGVYRFVDKIYTAQVVNYGKRLMLEFIVPEPAAFWRYALTKQPLAPVQYTNPDPPGFCLDDGRTFVPLQAADITPERYMDWASAYGASDVQPPPPRTRIVSASKKGPDSFPTSDGTPASPKINSDTMDISIPDGYSPVRANINAYGETQVGEHKLVIQVQDQQFVYTEPMDDLLSLDLKLETTDKVALSVNALRFHNYELVVTIFCALTKEAYEAWQLKTFSSIMQAYQAAKSAYDNAQEVAQVRAGYNLPLSRNPAENREIERAELKRACISIMSGQRFETFDAMNRDVAPYGYPEIDFADAKAEARFIKLFEQGLEWENISYLFYSYFWSRKDQWLTLVQLEDDDPLFNRFLQAGAARVQVPARPGFEAVVLNYLAGVEIWDADGNLINADGNGPDQVQLSMVAELKSQLGNDDVDGEGTVALTNGDNLVVGTGTRFTADDANRRIRFGTRTRVIKSVEPPNRIRLTEAYDGPTDSHAVYALGPVLVGGPWEVRLPTDLVMLGDYPIS